MIAIVRLTGRLLLGYGPVILSLYLGGILARYLAIEAVGWVGAYSAVAGALLFPVIVLCRLVPLVAMLLVLRGGMSTLAALTPTRTGRAARSRGARGRTFADALLAGALPFIAFYAAWGYLREDASAYYSRLLEVNRGLIAEEVFSGAERAGDAAVGELTFGPLTVAIIAVAFALRWAWNRYRSRLPGGLAAAAVYLEVLWIFLSVTLIAEAVDGTTAWIDGRQAMVWLADARAWMGEQLTAVAWVWEGIEWLLGELGGILLLPLAWLTVAGVICGQAIAPDALALRGGLADRVRGRLDSIPARLLARLRDVWDELVSRFRPVGNAIVLMWRAGPVLVGGYVLLYTVLLGLESLLGIAVTRVIGPQPLAQWMEMSTLVFLVVPVLLEPVRLCLVASAYDGVLARLTGSSAAARRPVGMPEGQGSTMNRARSGSASPESTSTPNGPRASDGTR